MRFVDSDILHGVLKTLQATGRAMRLADYAIEHKDGAVDGAKIAGQF